MRLPAPHEPELAVVLDQLGVGAAPLLGAGMKRTASHREAVDELLAEPADDLAAATVVEREQQDDQPSGRHPAQRPVAFEEDRLRSGPGGCGGGRNAGRAAARDEDVALRDDRYFPGLLAVRSGAHRVPRKDAASRCFCTFPTAVRGSSATNSILCGRLKAASAPRQCARISSVFGRSPSRTTKAATD